VPNGDGPEFQTRSEENGLKYFESLKLAMAEALNDDSVWKISFPISAHERIRLVRHYVPTSRPGLYDTAWWYEPLEEEIEKEIKRRGK